jgi:tetratricopeptide (TPR) repeat protein
MLADMYSSSGQPEKAATLLSEYLDQPFDLIAYAKHLLLAGRRPEAEGALAEATRRSHQSAEAPWADLALARADAFRSEGRFGDAQDALQQGLDRGVRGGVERLHLAMASLLLDWGRRREATAHLRRIKIELARNRIVHGVLSARAGDLGTAKANLERLEKEADASKAPRAEARVHQLRAEIELAGGQPAAGHDYAGRAVQAFDTPWTLTTLARAQQSAGMISQAITTWTSILERQGERTIDWDAPAFSQVVLAHYELARVLEQAGRVDEARARYDDFLRLWERADAELPPFVDARERRVRLAPRPGSERP